MKSTVVFLFTLKNLIHRIPKSWPSCIVLMQEDWQSPMVWSYNNLVSTYFKGKQIKTDCAIKCLWSSNLSPLLPDHRELMCTGNLRKLVNCLSSKTKTNLLQWTNFQFSIIICRQSRTIFFLDSRGQQMLLS